jgi:hypothetical protein
MFRKYEAAAVVVSTCFLICATSTPAQDVLVDAAGQNTGSLTGALKFGGTEPNEAICAPVQVGHGVPVRAPCPPGPTKEGIASTRTPGGPAALGQPIRLPSNQYGLDLYTDAQPRLSITHAGQIGIGTQAPAYAVHIRQAGDVQLGLDSTVAGGRLWTIQSSGTTDPPLTGTFQIVDRTAQVSRLQIDAQGLVSVNALKINGGADLAESFGTSQRFEPGTVVSIDAQNVGRVKLSDRAYDKRVAGIVSGALGVEPGVTLEQLKGDTRTEQVALTGRVYVMADTSSGAIAPGDLLTTSAVPGHAMKAADYRRARGATLGKAMSALSRGSGMVLVLVGLQ